jgi:hypothetical protein
VDDRKLDVRWNRNCVCSSDSGVKVKVMKEVEIRLQVLWMTSAVLSSYGQGLFADMVKSVRVLVSCFTAFSVIHFFRILCQTVFETFDFSRVSVFR